MPASFTLAPRPIQLPAVLQLAGHAPSFGTLATLSEQGLTFEFLQTGPSLRAIGAQAHLDFDLKGQHYHCPCLLVRVQGKRGLLSLRGSSTHVIAALSTVNREQVLPLSARLALLQTQQACHTQFMAAMKPVLDRFFRQLAQPGGSAHDTALHSALAPLRPALTRALTEIYPMFPASANEAADASGGATPDIERLDDWIQRSGVAHAVDEVLKPLPEAFARQYAAMLRLGDKPARHPYQAEAVLDVLADLILPLGLDAALRARCYQLMGDALQAHGLVLYETLLQAIGETPTAADKPTAAEANDLAAWLRQALQPGSAHAGSATAAAAGGPDGSSDWLTAMTANLQPPQDGMLEATAAPDTPATARLVPGLLARERILTRFLPAGQLAGGETAREPGGPSPTSLGATFGGLSSLDSAALESLYTQLMQPPPVDPGPERLAPSSQVRALMLQAQGLLLDYTMNGLTYQDQPDHPAWHLLNGLDTLHLGADDHGQFLDQGLHHALTLAMQWLLGQEQNDAAVVQVNTLLDRINAQFRAERGARRQAQLAALGEAEPVQSPAASTWCVVKHGNEAVPHEVLGRFDGLWALLNRSATQLQRVPDEQFVDDLEAGHVEATGSFDEPFLERIASATLTASLDAVHAFTWQDPASGCLKRSALIDELERRLVNPVSDPPSFCALIEIPSMRPTLSTLPADELAVLQQRTGEILLDMLQPAERCGRLSDVSFLLVFSPQDAGSLKSRLTAVKEQIEALHPDWKMIGAAVPLVEVGTPATPSAVLARANQACAPLRQDAGFDLTRLEYAAAAKTVTSLPFDALYLRCQKIAACGTGAASHYEILLGLREDAISDHTTQSFVVMAEQNGLIQDLDAWVLQSTLQWMDRQGSELDSLSGLSVNVSGNSLMQREHVDRILGLLGEHRHLTNKLILEVTETAAIGSMEVAVRALCKLKKLGCRVALDDFGSGYSSFGYLRQLPLDYLKIDGTYIRNVLTDRTDQALTASMVEVAHALGLKVIAEYVDSEATSTWLKDIGVDYLQGYWVHKPQRLDELALH